MKWHASRLGDRVKSRIQNEFGPLFHRLIVIVVYAIAVVHILHYFEKDVSSIIVSLGVGSLAVALAAKDTLANMISGFMIMTDRPFRIGDRIMLESGEKGDVYDVGLRSTKILTFDNTLISPEGGLFKKGRGSGLSRYLLFFGINKFRLLATGLWLLVRKIRKNHM